MKTHTLLSILMLFSTYSISAQDFQPYIIPVEADGTLAMDGDQYAHRIAMTPSGDGYKAENVSLTDGFYFLGQNSTDTKGSLYSLTPWAVTPIPMNLPNPLQIATSSNDPIKLPAGKYDIAFYHRTMAGIGYNLFTVTDVSARGKRTYPPYLYLISADGTYTRLDDHNGVYYTTMQLPSTFRISYEPRYNMAPFIYGPTSGSDTELSLDTPVSIGYGDGTSAIFTSPYSHEVNLLIDIRDSNTFKISEQAIDGVESVIVDNNDSATIYDMSGRPVGTSNFDGLTPGIYIVRQGSQVTKYLKQ